jgi:hypothetical protein
MHGELLKITYLHYQRQYRMVGPSDISAHNQVSNFPSTPNILCHLGGAFTALSHERVDTRRVLLACYITGGLMLGFEVAAETREETPWKGTRPLVGQ